MRGKLILEKVPGKVRETFMLLKVLGGCVKNKCWKTNVGKSWSYCGDLISSEKVKTLRLSFHFS